MSSGLPINSFAQAAEYRKRYLADLALTAQNEAYNLQANQVFRQTGQPSRPPDTRTTTEKLGDIEAMKIALRRGLMGVTDGSEANETVENLTVDEVIFTNQQLPAIIGELKPRFANGVPAQALLAYIRALRRKFLATNGVSFAGQEATSQQILNAIQAGVAALNAPSGPIGIAGSTPSAPVPGPSPSIPSVPSGPAPSVPTSSEDLMLQEFRQQFEEKAMRFGPDSKQEWDAYPVAGGFAPFPESQSLQVEFLKIWARSQSPEIQARFKPTWLTLKTLKPLKRALEPGVLAKLSSPPGLVRTVTVEPDVTGTSMRRRPKSYLPMGRTISGYGLSLPKKAKKAIQVDMSRGLAYESAPSYIAFGKYVINPNKMSSGVFDMKTMKGGLVVKYPTKMLSAKLSKMINRIIGGRMPDEEDFNEMDLTDQNFLFNLANDAKIMDRLKLPTPKRTKEGEETNRFEILRGQLISGNDNKELIKEFKQMLLKLSDEGRIKKSEAREILLDLVALGH
jgi:hypothetical protein